MLNACEGARAALDDQFAGTAQSLVQLGIPAVIAMQFRITDQASILLAREFYGALADGYPVDAALTEARKAIKTEGNDLEWGTPVLYMRSPDGHIFDIAQIPASSWSAPPVQAQDPEKAARLNRLYTEGLEAFYLGKWEAAFRKFQAVADSAPDHKDAAEKLELSRKKMEVQALDEQAQGAEQAGDWDKVIQALDKLAAADPTYPEITSRMAKARRQAQLADLYDEARQLAAAEKWQGIPGIFKEIDQLSPRYPDPDQLRARAQQQVNKSRREAELDSAYTAALRAFEASDWKTAIRHLRHVRRLEPGYRETDRLLNRAEAETEQKKRAGKKAQEAPLAPAGIREILLLQLFLFAAFTNLITRLLMEQLGLPENPFFSQWFTMPAQSGIAGIAAIWLVTRVGGSLDRRSALYAIAFCVIWQTAVVQLGTLVDPTYTSWLWMIVSFVMGIGIGLVVCFYTGRARQRFSPSSRLSLVIGWGLASAIGQSTAGVVTGALGSIPTLSIFIAIEQALAILLGAWLTVAMIEPTGEQRLYWLTVVGGAVGFGFGNLLTNFLFSTIEGRSWEVAQVLLWGLIAGAVVALPSKKYKRCLPFAFGTGLAMALPRLLLTGDAAGSLWRWLLTGTLTGLWFGWDTRRPYSLVLCMLLGTVTFSLRFWLNSTFNIFSIEWKGLSWLALAVTSAVMGAILAAGWSHLRSGNPPPLAQRD
jgi:tetratricopeptide (TPR) repeat protein